MKKKIMISTLILCLALSAFTGCGASKSAERAMRVDSHNGSTNAVLAEIGGSGEYAYAEETMAAADEAYDVEYEAETPAAYNGDIFADASNSADTTSSAEATQKADAKKDMLVFRSTIKIDTTDFDTSVHDLKVKINEYHGFLEYEYQTDGSAYDGPEVLDESEKNYTYTATIRIPSEYYESFVNATDGLGYLRSKNSSVDNVSTEYGTLKNELEIYEAEYDRYLEQYENTKDDNVALTIQRELRSLAVTISDIKTRLSSIESDVAYSYVTITIHKVRPAVIEEAIEKEEEFEKEDTFKTRVSDAAKESWKQFLAFLEGLLIFFIETWWGLLIFGIICLIIFLCIRRAVKKHNKKVEAQKREIEEKQLARAKELAKAASEAEKKFAKPENKQADKPDTKPEEKKDEKPNK